mmetsp:Transcript_2881/g.4339  ORF Transcript_2881/g.4339 Transcript_2881/m.4339 type:complete len:421 (+) Transcript_2881:78-1340(+)
MSTISTTATTITGHAVCRTSEFLSCAKTALKIAQQQPSEGWWSHMGDPSLLTLHDINASDQNTNPILATLFEDGCALLRTMDASLETLQGLVRRRGHTNDPTPEIAVTTQQMEADMKELKTVIAQLQSFPISGKQQQKKHLEWVSKWLQTVSSQHSSRLKEILKVRGTVLADQAQRRKRFQTNTSAVKSKSKLSSSNGTIASLQVSSTPLFTATATPHTKQSPAATMNNGHGRTPPTYYGNNSQSSHNYYGNSSTPTPATSGGGGYGGGSNGGYGGGYGGTGSTAYGGYYQSAPNMGMRQRKGSQQTQNSTTDVDQTQYVQQQVQMRRQERQTQQRLNMAQEAEASLASLTTMFSKMSTLIVQQGETLEKLEDDVESAAVDIAAGQSEIQTLYSMKKGNRGLIIKTFGVIIFVIIFMRFY